MSYHGIFIESYYGESKSNTLSNNIVNSSSDYGIHIEGDFNILENSFANYNDDDGISDSDDSMIDDGDLEGSTGYGKPDWWCEKHPNKC